MWGALENLGFEQGDVLEPGVGSGTFIGLAPEGARVTGVELDPTTAAITRGIYPQADILTESFADSNFADGSFDLAVGNVPFGDITLHDTRHNAGRHSLHNHFIVKSLALTRPGGYVAVITSAFTMDAASPSARREMNGMGDLVGAVRLPSGAHRRAAGTEALTDLLIFRKREPGVPPRDRSWEQVEPRIVDGAQVQINTYFQTHPEHVLGTFTVRNGMYGAETLGVRSDDLSTTGSRLHAALDDIVSRAQARGEQYVPATPAQQAQRELRKAAVTSEWDGTIRARQDGAGFEVAYAGTFTDFPVPKSQATELRALLTLRDRARDVLDAEAATTADSPELQELRGRLSTAYEQYAARFGPLNRYTERATGRFEPVVDDMTGKPKLDPATGKPMPSDVPLMARVKPPVMAKFRDDPFASLVMALERFDEETQTATASEIQRQRVVMPRSVQEHAGTAAEAVALALNESGELSLARIAELLRTSETDAREQLGALVYDDPVAGRIVHAPEYLSGNIREKLDAATAAAETDPAMVQNIAALKEVLPTPLGMDEIEARLGAVWISPEIHQDFLREILRDDSVRVENPMPGSWEVRGGRNGLRSVEEWGTIRRPAPDVAQAVMEQRKIVVYDKVDDKQILNPVETTAAQEKAEALQERFSAWVWEEPTRAAALVDEYNKRFNSISLRDYTTAGEHLTFPGLSASLTLRPHQRAAVARMISEPAVGLFHGVGAGKTFEMIVGATEMRRMGLVNKPVLVVPNHMLEQFTREWLQAYPQARILAASTADLQKDRRKLFVARAAANDWDGIVMTHSAFKLIGNDPAFEQRYRENEIGLLRNALTAAQAEGAMSVKRMEKRLAQLEEKQKRSLDMKHDAGISFQDTGIDYIVVDEAHLYKNLATESNIADAAIDGSQMASDMHMKFEYLRERYGDRVGTMATATPIANSITEAHVMQRYLRPDLLRNAGVENFDAWAATFGTQVTQMELGPAGGFRLKQRFAKFQNVPEMLRMWHVFADVKTQADLSLPVPAVRARESDGARETENVILQPTAELTDYIADIASRAEAVEARRVTPEEDNMLLISGDGRKAALDLRLVDQEAVPTGYVKLDAVAAKVLSEWEATKNNEYVDSMTQTISPVRGGLQIVFSDLGTPNDTRWDAYNELKLKLIDGGMPADSIRFIHEAKDDRAKARMFAAARAGHVAVLMGSTAKMGMGTNVQDRVTALHHIDCPWRPADIEQRDGRAIRQGNQNAEVGMYRYVVEGSFDAYSWQTVGRKAAFIAQIMRGRLDVREIEDIGDVAMSATEAKALASGNPLVLERATAESEYQKLRRQDIAHNRAQITLAQTRQNASTHLDQQEANLVGLNAARERTQSRRDSDTFTIEIDGQTFTARTDAAAAIASFATSRRSEIIARHGEPIVMGSYAGHTIMLAAERAVFDYVPRTDAVISLQNVPLSSSRAPYADLQSGGLGVIRVIENKPDAIERNIAKTEANIEEAQRTIADAESRLSAPFAKKDELEQALATVKRIDAQMAAQMSESQEGTSPEAVKAEPPLRRGNPSYPRGAADEMQRSSAGIGSTLTRSTRSTHELEKD